MIYDIRQTTTYHYASHVAYAHHVLRLTPIDRAGQRVHAAALDIEPAPVERREGSDFFGNRLTWIELDEPHDMLTMRVAARVAVERDGRARRGDHAAVGGGARRDAFASPISRRRRRRIFCFRAGRSRSIRKSATMRAESFPPGRPVLDGAIDLMRRIKADFVYEIGATTALDHAADVVRAAARRLPGLRAHHDLGPARARPAGGLCQRLSAHRSTRPARSGSTGADAMHAWVLVWCGEEAGWLGLDPTNADPRRRRSHRARDRPRLCRRRADRRRHLRVRRPAPRRVGERDAGPVGWVSAARVLSFLAVQSLPRVTQQRCFQVARPLLGYARKTRLSGIANTRAALTQPTRPTQSFTTRRARPPAPCADSRCASCGR